MKYSSKTLTHVYSYKPVSQPVNYALSFSIVSFVYTQLLAVVTPVVDTATSYPLVNKNVTFVDDKFNALVLDKFDAGVAGAKSYAAAKIDRVNSIAASINSKYLSYVNKYLPSNSSELKLSNNELSKFYQISNESLVRAKTLVVTNSNSLSNHLFSTYNSTFEADKSTGYTKRINVAISTVTKLLNELNNNYFTPIKNQTQDYVHDVATQTKNKADSFISEARQGIPSFIKGVVPPADAPGPVVSASPAVSASA